MIGGLLCLPYLDLVTGITTGTPSLGGLGLLVVRSRAVLSSEGMSDDAVNGVSSARVRFDAGGIAVGVTASLPVHSTGLRLFCTGVDGCAFDMCFRFLCRIVPASVSIWYDLGRAAGAMMLAVLHWPSVCFWKVTVSPEWSVGLDLACLSKYRFCLDWASSRFSRYFLVGTTCFRRCFSVQGKVERNWRLISSCAGAA